MYRFAYYFLRFLAGALACLVVACAPEPINPGPVPIQFSPQNLLTNGGFEQLEDSSASPSAWLGQSVPRGWTAFVGPTYAAKLTDAQAVSGQQAIQLSCNWTDPAAQAYIYQVLDNPMPSKRYRIEAFMRLDSIDGRGMSMSLLGFVGDIDCCAEYTYTNDGEANIKGISGWTPYTFTSPSMPADVDHLLIRINMQRSTTGRAYIDEVSLRVEE